jgi:hypothetical protein
MKNYVILLVSGFMVFGCSKIPGDAYNDRGAPESLLDVSSEQVTVELGSADSVDEIKEWIESDQPSRAIIYCVDGDVLCDSAEEVLGLYGVEYEWMQSDYSEISLIYERVIARDCDSSYIDSRINPYNLNHPTFGCSIASNMVQMVTNRNEFVNPDLLGYMDGRTTAKNMRAYRLFDAKRNFSSGSNNGLSVGTLNFNGS